MNIPVEISHHGSRSRCFPKWVGSDLSRAAWTLTELRTADPLIRRNEEELLEGDSVVAGERDTDSDLVSCCVRETFNRSF